MSVVCVSRVHSWDSLSVILHTKMRSTQPGRSRPVQAANPKPMHRTTQPVRRVAPPSSSCRIFTPATNRNVLPSRRANILPITQRRTQPVASQSRPTTSVETSQRSMQASTSVVAAAVSTTPAESSAPTINQAVELARQIKALQDQLVALTQQMSHKDESVTTVKSDDDKVYCDTMSIPTPEPLLPPHMISTCDSTCTPTPYPDDIMSSDNTIVPNFTSSLPVPLPTLMQATQPPIECLYIPLGKRIVFGSTVNPSFDVDHPDERSVSIELVPQTSNQNWASYQAEHRGCLFLRTCVYRLGEWKPVQSVPITDFLK